jgi:hypothetical protein
MRQLLTETVVLALLGGGVGRFGYWGVRLSSLPVPATSPGLPKCRWMARRCVSLSAPP